MIEQVLGNVTEDHRTAGNPFQRAEGDQPIAAADVEHRIAFGEARVIQHLIPHGPQKIQN